MIETNCWMPEELYNDWLLEQGYENDVDDFLNCLICCISTIDGEGYGEGGYDFNETYYGSGIEYGYAEIWNNVNGVVLNGYSGSGLLRKRDNVQFGCIFDD